MVSHYELNGVCVIICKAHLGAFFGVSDRESIVRLKMSQIEGGVCVLDCFFSRENVSSLWKADALLLGSHPGCRDSGGRDRDEGRLLQVQDKTDPCLCMQCPLSCGRLALTSAQRFVSHLHCPGRFCGLWASFVYVCCRVTLCPLPVALPLSLAGSLK